MGKGKFIVFEGIDASGKTTQSKMLRRYLVGKRLDVYWTHECSDGPIGKVIREEYLSGKRQGDPRILNMLYAIDRLDHLTNNEDGIINFIENEVNVISDRYYMSSIAYHGSLFIYKPDLYHSELYSIYKQNLINMKLLKPDITIYIDINPEDAYSRLQSRNENKEIFDSLVSLRRVHLAYKDAINILKDSNESIAIIDGNKSVEEVFNNVLKVIRSNKILDI